MAFEQLFDNPLYGDHAPLVLRWSDDQLAAIAECLAPLLPDNLSDQMMPRHREHRQVDRRGARHLRSSGALSPGQRPLTARPKRYRDGDPRLHVVLPDEGYGHPARRGSDRARCREVEPLRQGLPIGRLGHRQARRTGRAPDRYLGSPVGSLRGWKPSSCVTVLIRPRSITPRRRTR